jgi:hypothetical protein
VTPAASLKKPAVKVTKKVVNKKPKKSTKKNAIASTSPKKKVKPVAVKAPVIVPKVTSTKVVTVKPSSVIANTVESTEKSVVNSEIGEQVAELTNPKKHVDVQVNTLENDSDGVSVAVIDTVQEQADGIDVNPPLPIKDAVVPAVAMLTPAAPTPDFSLEQLPMSFNQWSLGIVGVDKCMLTSKPMPIQDGQGGTKVVAEITENVLVLKTRSIIDESYENTGIQINGNQQRPIERLHSESSIAYSAQYADIMQALRQEGVLIVSLGFWPTWPVTQAYQASINLNGFNQAFQALQYCREELSKN